MKHIDVATFQFLWRLKACNVFWYRALMECAKRDAKTTRQCIEGACKAMKIPGMEPDSVSAFQICKAVNSGNITEKTFEHVPSYASEMLINLNLKRIKADDALRRF